MLALDVSDGRERWRWSGDGPAVGASPVMPLIGGRRQLVFKSLEHIVGLDPRSGGELWRIPYRVSQDNTIVTPLVIGDLLVTSDWDEGLRAWRIEGQEGAWSAREVWNTRAASIFTSSPVPVRAQDGTLVVGFSHLNSGQLFVLDPIAGEVLWRGRARSGEHVTLVAWGDQVLVFGEDGSLVVGEVSRAGVRPLREYALGRSGAWAHPAIADDVVVIRDRDRLAAFRFDPGAG
jgi:outer membrane protein assembly factor BamB